MDIIALGLAGEALDTASSSISGWKDITLDEQTGVVTAINPSGKTFKWQYPIPKNGVGVDNIYVQPVVDEQGVEHLELLVEYTDGRVGHAGYLPEGKEGPQGPIGPVGPTGAQGRDGEMGPQGIQGLPGERGPEGPQGAQGPQGIPGPAGKDGEKGETGLTGPAGPQGEQGPIGPQGIPGPQGPAGADGLQGERGPEGPMGPQGVPGEKGEQGEQGPQGIPGEKGEKGKDGLPFLIYKQYNSIDEFSAGDFPQIGLMFMVMQYEENKGYPIYRYSGNGEYSFISYMNTQGIQGPPGEKGETGPQGPAGKDGEQGPQGIQGIQGPPGETGPQGEAGPEGKQGPEGQQGIQGPEGPQGIPGVDGINGINGEDGFSPVITVKEETDTSYKLTITDKTHTFDTPNLKATSTEGTKDYNELDNKPSINGIDLQGALSSEDLQLLTESDVEAIVDDKTADFATRSEIPENVSDLNNDSGYITRQDFASTSEAGTVKVNTTSFDLNINQRGEIYPSDLSYAQYQSKSSYSFVSKGTLEKAIEGKDLSDKKYVQDYVAEHGGTTVILDTEMSDTSENGVQNKVIKGYIDTEVDQVKLAKFPNVVLVGNPVINNGQVRGFSTSSYCRFPFLVDLTNKAFEINFDILTGSNVATQENIFDSDFGFAFAIRNSRFVIAMSSNGTSWDIGEGVGTGVVFPNTSYKIKISWDKASYKLQFSTNGGELWVDDITKASNLSLYPRQIFIGVGENNLQVQNVFSGMIDFTNANLIIDGIVKWVGLDVVGLETRLATDLSNVDSAGEQRIKEIAGQSIDVDSEMSDTSTNAVQNKVIKAYVDSHSVGGGVTNVYIRDEADELSADWLSLTEGGEAITPNPEGLYCIRSVGEYYSKTLIWDAASSEYQLTDSNLLRDSGIVGSVDIVDEKNKYSLSCVGANRLSYRVTIYNPLSDNYRDVKIEVDGIVYVDWTFENPGYGSSTDTFTGSIDLPNGASNVELISRTGSVLRSGYLRAINTKKELSRLFDNNNDGLVPKTIEAEETNVLTPNGWRNIYTDSEMSDVSENAVKNKVIKGYVDEKLLLSGEMHVPIGAIVSFMSDIAPAGFLVCDGALYEISKYPTLFELIGTKFGGDGVNTFAVPNLQGEFLRGAGENSHTNQGRGGSVGEHQDGTSVPALRYDGGIRVYDGSTESHYMINNFDGTLDGTRNYMLVNPASVKSSTTNVQRMNLRPTNTSVLYCIKAYKTMDDYGLDVKYDELSKTLTFTDQRKYVELTEEHLTGETLNGKPVYEKVVIGTSGATSSGGSIDVSDIPIDIVLSIDGTVFLSDATSKQYMKLGMGISTSNLSSVYYVNGLIIPRVTNSTYFNKPVWVTLKYTKTTD